MWDGVRDRLSEKFQVVTTDFRGHRYSTAPGAFSLEDLAGDLVAVLDTLSLERAVVCGLSMGGMAAMRMALKNPDRVCGLGLFDTDAAPEAIPKRLQYEGMVRIYRRFGIHPLIEGRVAKLLFGATALREQPTLWEKVRDGVATYDRGSLIYAIQAVFRRQSIVGRLHEIDCPTVAVVGDEDLATLPSQTNQIEAGISGSTKVVLPKTGHLSALEQPQRVAEIIEDLLGRCYPG
jgi:pimeloyl-ACP methyl ester carboxylesterase